MLTKIRDTIRQAPAYVGLVLLLLGFFTWAELSGTRLLGDDKYETEKHGYGAGSGGHGYRGRSAFFHK